MSEVKRADMYSTKGLWAPAYSTVSHSKRFLAVRGEVTQGIDVRSYLVCGHFIISVYL